MTVQTSPLQSIVYMSLTAAYRNIGGEKYRNV